MTIAVSRLRPDWLATVGSICSRVSGRAMGQGAHINLQLAGLLSLFLSSGCSAILQTGVGAEAPAVFKHSSKHYIFASHLTGVTVGSQREKGTAA